MHDFLNASPLLLPLKEKGANVGFQMVTDSPASLADRLQSGDLDLAMIPTVEYFRSADRYRIVPNACIASRGPVGTVLFLTKKPISEISSIAADIRSRTSVALLQILFPFSSDLSIHPFLPDPKTMLADHSSALIIGDSAFTLGDLDPNVTVYDLSAEWFRHTGKTFVHAVVALRQGVVLRSAQKNFIQNSKLEGLRRIKEIVRAHKGLSGVSLEMLEGYLENKIKYNLDQEAMEGLIHFSNLCYEHGIIPKKISTKFV